MIAGDERRFGSYEKISWMDYVDGHDKSDAYQEYLADGLNQRTVAASGKRVSARTVGLTLLRIMLDWIDPDTSIDRVLDGPTSERWITPWRDHLVSLGVVFEQSCTLEDLTWDRDDGITGATIARHGVSEPVTADAYLVALPVAFMITFGAGVALERLVIRWLYHRPLETLLATFGVSIALQQLAKNIFGTQARPLTSPDWLGGALVINDALSISYIRIAIFVLALMFLGLLLFILKKTRLGLEVRAVTQNPRMAASMGINPDRIKMMTFGLGSGIAGIAGVAIGLYAKVTSEMGSDYIVQSFMTVVVGGVGNVWGTLAGAGLIGILQKGIEWFNPSNTLAAQTYMILFIILFIQFRPKGIFALKGRAAGD